MLGTCHLRNGLGAAQQVDEGVQRVVGQIHGVHRLQRLLLALVSRGPLLLRLLPLQLFQRRLPRPPPSGPHPLRWYNFLHTLQ